MLDVLSLRVKTGISHARLRPTLAVVDPLLTLTQPAGVTASAGMDILCHALESYTARWYTSAERKRPEQRVPYCGANPISDMWSEKAMGLLAGSFRKAVRDGGRPRGPGRHGHGGHVRRDGFRQRRSAHPARQRLPDRGPGERLPAAQDYPADEPMVPHGMSVALTAAEAFRFTFDAAPERHVRAARLLAPGAEQPSDPAEFLPRVLNDADARHRSPTGVARSDTPTGTSPTLVEGTLKPDFGHELDLILIAGR